MVIMSGSNIRISSFNPLINALDRILTLKLEQVAGTINMFYAFINGKRVIADQGINPAEWTDTIPEGEVKLKVRVSGIDTASYKVTIDLPGTADDQEITFELEGGYHEFEMRI
jgi:hypothetical protein